MNLRTIDIYRCYDKIFERVTINRITETINTKLIEQAVGFRSGRGFVLDKPYTPGTIYLRWFEEQKGNLDSFFFGV